MLCGETRWNKGNWIWWAWLIAFVASTAKPFLWHVDYFRSPGPQFYTLFLIALPAFAAALALYAWLRRKTIWRYEPLLATGALAAAFVAYEPLASLVVTSMFLACYAMGRAIVRKLGLDLDDPLGAIAIPAAAGFALLSYVLLWIGLARLFYPVVFVLLIAAPLVVWRREWIALGRTVRALWAKWTSDGELSRPLAGVAVAFAALAGVMTAMVVLAPSVVFDSLKFHITLAGSFARQHSLDPLPLLDYSYFPQGLEVLMTAAHALAGQAGAQMVPAVFFLVALLLMMSIARRAGASRLGVLTGVVAAISLPFLHWTGSVAKNDMALAAYQFGALDAYLRWRADGRFRWIWLGAFFVAASFSVKHVALIGGLGLGVLYLHAAWTERRRWTLFAGPVIIFAVFGLCWHARAYLMTGNPVYPEWLSHGVSVQFPTRQVPQGNAIVRAITRPWRLFSEGKPFFESPLEYPLGAALLFSLPMWVLVRRRSDAPAETACLVFLGVSLAYWIYHVPGLRYATAPLALLTVLSAARLPAFGDAHGRFTRASAVAVLGYVLLFGVCGALIIEVNAPQLQYFARRLDKSGYLHEALRTYGSMEFLRRAAQPGERVFGVSNCSYAYAPEPANMQCYMRRREVYSESDFKNVRDWLPLGGFRYLIVPCDASGDAFRHGIAPLDGAQPAYRDAYFEIYRVPLSPLGVSHSQQSLQR